MKTLKGGVCAGPCGNNSIVKQIRACVSELESKIFAFPLFFQMEGRNNKIEKTITMQTSLLPGKQLLHLNIYINTLIFIKKPICILTVRENKSQCFRDSSNCQERFNEKLSRITI